MGYLTSSPVGVVFDSKKGDFSNRAECAGEHLKNNAKTMVTTTVASVAAARSIALINKGKLDHLATKIDKVAASLAGKANMPKPIRGALKMIGNASKKSKLFGLIAAPLIGITVHCLAKGTFKQGQIDQKYTDKASVEKNAQKVLIA